MLFFICAPGAGQATSRPAPGARRRPPLARTGASRATSAPPAPRPAPAGRAARAAATAPARRASPATARACAWPTAPSATGAARSAPTAPTTAGASTASGPARHAIPVELACPHHSIASGFAVTPGGRALDWIVYDLCHFGADLLVLHGRSPPSAQRFVHISVLYLPPSPMSNEPHCPMNTGCPDGHATHSQSVPNHTVSIVVLVIIRLGWGHLPSKISSRTAEDAICGI